MRPREGNMKPPKSYLAPTVASLRHPKVELGPLDSNLMPININIGPTKSILGLTESWGLLRVTLDLPWGALRLLGAMWGPSEGNFGPL